jgi:hypothetical protein
MIERDRLIRGYCQYIFAVPYYEIRRRALRGRRDQDAERPGRLQILGFQHTSQNPAELLQIHQCIPGGRFVTVRIDVEWADVQITPLVLCPKWPSGQQDSEHYDTNALAPRREVLPLRKRSVDCNAGVAWKRQNTNSQRRLFA